MAIAYNASLNPIDILPLNCRQILEQTEDCVFVASMVLNMLLAVVLITEKSKILEVYSRVLLQNCVCDMIYAIASVTTKLECEFYEGQLVFLIDGIYRNLSFEWHFVGLTFYVYTLYLSMFVIPIVFYFRYCLVVRNVHLTNRKLWKILSFLMVFTLVPAVAILMACMATYNYGEQREHYCKTIFAHPMWTYGNAPISSCLITKADNPFLLVYYCFLAFGNVTMYGTMIFCTKAAFAALKTARPNLREKTAKLQRQMNMLLLIQLVIPTACATLPLTIAVISCTLRLTFPGLAMFVLFGFVWIPLINPCITMILVSNYRKKCIKLITAPIRNLFSVCCANSVHVSSTTDATTDKNSTSDIQFY